MNKIRFTLRTRGGTYPVDLQYKQTRMHSAEVVQFWIDIRTLYDPRPNGQQNSWSIVEHFWDLCRRHGTQSHQPVVESYLLARLLPFSRHNGARRVLADARQNSPGGSKGQDRRSTLAELEKLLRASAAASQRIRFRDQTAAALGLPNVSPLVLKIYEAFTAELFSDAHHRIASDREAAVASMIARWDNAMRRWGRHRGNVEWKQVLDILSYETRVAFHRAYSAMWLELMPDLQHAFSLGAEDVRLMHLWHLDHSSESNIPDVPFSLFHGHIFGLHPALSMLAQTPTGRDIIGQYIVAPTPELQERPFQRLLHAAEIAVHVYLARREELAQSRRKRPYTFGADHESADQRPNERRLGRSRRSIDR